MSPTPSCRRDATWLDTWFTMWSSEHNRATPASLRCDTMHLGDPFDFIVIGAGTAEIGRAHV